MAKSTTRIGGDFVSVKVDSNNYYFNMRTLQIRKLEDFNPSQLIVGEFETRPNSEWVEILNHIFVNGDMKWGFYTPVYNNMIIEQVFHKTPNLDGDYWILHDDTIFCTMYGEDPEMDKLMESLPLSFVLMRKLKHFHPEFTHVGNVYLSEDL